MGQPGEAGRHGVPLEASEAKEMFVWQVVAYVSRRCKMFLFAVADGLEPVQNDLMVL